MTITLTILALALGPPPADRGGHAETVPPARGGQAHLIVGMLDGEPITHVRLLPTFRAFVCIHQHEGRWNDPGDPYWGGLQMDQSFMLGYGRDMIARHGGRWADAWTPAEQILVATRAWLTRGYGPWPNTRIPCGV